MFKPCPRCGFLVALIAGRETSQRCPRCGSGLVEPDELPISPDAAAPASHPGEARSDVAPRPDAASPTDARRRLETGSRRDTGEAAPTTPMRESDHATAPRDEAGAKQPLSAPFDATEVPSTRVPHDAVGTSDADVDPAPTAAPDPRDVAAPLAPTSAAGDMVTASDPDAPAFARRHARDRPQRPTTGRRWPWWAAIVALALLLALQLLLAQQRELAADARWRPVLVHLCPVFGCALPPWREPAAYAMLARNVRPHGARPGVLRASTTVRNDAKWPQPLPVVVLSLSDLDGRIVGTRAVPPRDYSRTPGALVTPGTSIDIAFDVREPAGRVVSFDFRLQ